MTNDAHRVGVVCLGDVDPMVPKVLAAHISGYLSLSAIRLPPLPGPGYALNPHRRQYDAGLILRALEREPLARGVDKVIGILGEDLFVPIFTHVLGEARQGGRAALVSLFRLEEAASPPEARTALRLERAAKIALHEICHLYGLAHCTDWRCLMHFSGDVAELDRTPFSFCRYCAVFFQGAARPKKPQSL